MRPSGTSRPAGSRGRNGGSDPEDEEALGQRGSGGGSPPAIYDAYSRGVREEYLWAPDEIYKPGRSAFLRGAIVRDRLFRTEAFETKFGAQARVNMARELAALEAGE